LNSYFNLNQKHVVHSQKKKKGTKADTRAVPFVHFRC